MGAESITFQEELLIIAGACLFASVVYHLRIIGWYASRLAYHYNPGNGEVGDNHVPQESKNSYPGAYWKLTCLLAGLLFIYFMQKL